MIQRFVAASNQGLEHAQAVASQALSDTQYLANKVRLNDKVLDSLVLNRIISDQTGSDDVLSERILSSRSVQFQPQEATNSDPNYRPGASPPSAPKTAAAGS